jgi:misacylated tRNA(Ala) deacylase
MPTKFLYWWDSYKREFDAVVTRVEGNRVWLDQTLFHPRSGGVANDTGKLVWQGEEYVVSEVVKEGEDAVHVLDREPRFRVGDSVHGMIDWERRYRLMRLHTATHIIAALAYKRYNAMVTGGDITPEYARDDYNLNLSGDALRKAFQDLINEANEVVKRGLPVKIYFLKREEALKIPGIVKLAEREPPPGDEWRIVEIEGIDVQADGGPHVANTREIGEVVFMKSESRGKDKKRVYYTVKP